RRNRRWERFVRRPSFGRSGERGWAPGWLGGSAAAAGAADAATEVRTAERMRERRLITVASTVGGVALLCVRTSLDAVDNSGANLFERCTSNRFAQGVDLLGDALRSPAPRWTRRRGDGRWESLTRSRSAMWPGTPGCPKGPSPSPTPANGRYRRRHDAACSRRPSS